ncbi:MAG TPA: hypothetical protein VF668_09710 [Pyrinomonadaceae bacterium]|jgi:hypothetical protein
MQNPFQDNLRRPWLLLCVTLLVIYSITSLMPGAGETLFFDDAAGSLLEALMFLLSFPLGAAAAAPFHSADLGVKGRFAFWALGMGVGYAQWFHLFPALLRRAAPGQTHTALNLSPAAAPAREPLGPNVTRPLGDRLDAARPPIPQFNDRGLTPLERVFREEE